MHRRSAAGGAEGERALVRARGRRAAGGRAWPAARYLVPGRAHLRHAPDQPLLHQVGGGGGAEVRTPERRQQPAARAAERQGLEAPKRDVRTTGPDDPAVSPCTGTFTRRAAVAV